MSPTPLRARLLAAAAASIVTFTLLQSVASLARPVAAAQVARANSSVVVFALLHANIHP